MGRLARGDGERRNVFAAGVLIASAIMMVRVVVHHLPMAKDRDHHRGRECEGERDYSRQPRAQRQRPPDAPEQARQRVRPQPGRPLALRFSALLPAALYSNHEADGERDRQSASESKRIHETTKAGSKCAAYCSY
jgi:hypothetical protein